MSCSYGIFVVLDCSPGALIDKFKNHLEWCLNGQVQTPSSLVLERTSFNLVARNRMQIWRYHQYNLLNVTLNVINLKNLMLFLNMLLIYGEFRWERSWMVSSLLRPAQVMISSTLRIISAASTADRRMACFALNDSWIPSFYMSPTLPMICLGQHA